MKPAIRLAWIATLAVGLHVAGPLQAAVVTVDDFRRMDGAVFVEVGGSPTGAAEAGVTITGNPPSVGNLGLGASAVSPTGADPGDGYGWAAGSIVRHRFGDVPVVLDFDTAVAGFGVTFMHFWSPTFPPFNEPGILEVFDGPGGTGLQIGRIESNGGALEHLDFVAIWSDAVNIRSAVISVGSGSFAVDGYGFTGQTVPVPSPLLLLSPALLALAVSKRQRQ